MKDPFSISFLNNTVYISGDFRYGTFFEAWSKEIEDYLNQVPNPVLNFSETIFMDSDTMRFVRRIEDRVRVILTEDSWMSKRYQDYKDCKDAQEI